MTTAIKAQAAYKGVTITKTEKGYSYEVVTHNLWRSGTYHKSSTTCLLLETTKYAIDYLLENPKSKAANGLIYFHIASEAI